MIGTGIAWLCFNLNQDKQAFCLWFVVDAMLLIILCLLIENMIR